MFEKRSTFEKVRKSTVTKEVFENIYRAIVTEFEWFEPANALKVTLTRSRPSGGPGENDHYSCQQHVPLYDVEIPWEETS